MKPIGLWNADKHDPMGKIYTLEGPAPTKKIETNTFKDLLSSATQVPEANHDRFMPLNFNLYLYG
ncbi:MAG: hypothetical protein QWI37_01170 [Candidatus Cardinium sp.]|nr:hypothetical protein [Candidatus Cardinium sp.]